MVDLFRLEGVRRVFGGGGGAPEAALHFGTLSVPRGRTVAILGASGCGKSTLLDLLALTQRLQPGEGSITYIAPDGTETRYEDWTGPLAGLRRARFRGPRFGYVLQKDHLLENLSSLDNVNLPAILNGYRYERDLVEELFAHLGLEGKTGSNPAELSGGQRSRLAVVRGLLHDPDVLFADEPTANLDKRAEFEILSALSSWRREKPEERTLVLVTHSLQLAVDWADYFLWFPTPTPGSAVVGQPFEMKSGGAEDDAGKREIQAQIAADLRYPTVAASAVGSGAAADPETQERLRHWDAFFDRHEGRLPAGVHQRFWHNARLTFRDFFRHRRRQGSRLMTHGPPLIVVATVLFLTLAVFFLQGARSGTTALYEEGLANPFLWTTHVAGASDDVGRLDPSHFQAKAGFHRVGLTFVHGGNGRGVDLQGRTMSRGDPLSGVVAGSIGGRGGEGEVFDDDHRFGVILSRSALEKLGFDPSGPAPREVEFVLPIDDAGRYGSPHPGEVHVPMPLLGTAERLPYGHFLVSDGFFRAYRAGLIERFLRTDHVYAFFDPDLSAREKRALEDALGKAVAAEGLGAGVPLEVVEAAFERVGGREALYLQASQELYGFVLGNAIARAFGALGREPAWSWEPGGGWRLPGAGPNDPEVRNYTFLVHRDLDGVERFIEDCQAADLFVDTSITWKVRSLEGSSRMFTSLFDGAWYGVLLFSVVTIAIPLVLETYRKIHGVGVFYAMGGSLPRYLGMSAVQVLALCALAAGVAGTAGDRWLFPRAAELLNGVLGAGEDVVRYTALGLGTQLGVGLQMLAVVSAIVFGVRFGVGRKQPAELIRHQD